MPEENVGPLVSKKMTTRSDRIESVEHYSCIYCRSVGPAGVFNKDHVVPRLPGSFRGSLTLKNIVCRSCNTDYFGKVLEPMLANGSAESILRILVGGKHGRAAQYLRRDRIEFLSDQPEPYKGMILECVGADGELLVRAIPQVGFPKLRSGKFVFVPEWALADIGRPIPPPGTSSAAPRVVADSDKARDRLMELLKERGIEGLQVVATHQREPGGHETHPVDIVVKSDDLHMRCVAKIAFNYLAWVAGPEFVLHTDFDALRAFIRYGQCPSRSPVNVDDRPILWGDSPTHRQTFGHLVTLNWTGDRRALVARIGLFNHLRYSIMLTPNYHGLWRPLRSGHHFDVRRDVVEPLG